MYSKLASRGSAILAFLICGATLIAGCGGSEPSTSDGGPVEAPVPSPASAPAPAPPSAGTASLSWAAPGGVVSGFRVYYGTVSRNYHQPLGSGDFVATTTYQVSGLQSGRTYYFAVTAVDTFGAESGFSNEASKTIP